MLRYNIISGILLILPIIDLAVAAPVLVQEKCQACADVVHIHRNVVTVLGKRGVEEELEKFMKGFFEAKKNPPAASSGAHSSTGASSSSAPDAASPPESPTPFPVFEVTELPSTSGSSSHSSDSETFEWLFDENEVHEPGHAPTPEFHVLDYGLGDVPQPNANLNPKKRPLSGPGSPDPNFDWEHWSNVEDPPSKRPALSKEFNQPNENQVLHEPVQQSDPGQSMGIGPGPIYAPTPLSAVYPFESSMGAKFPTEPMHESVGWPLPGLVSEEPGHEPVSSPLPGLVSEEPGHELVGSPLSDLVSEAPGHESVGSPLPVPGHGPEAIAPSPEHEELYRPLSTPESIEPGHMSLPLSPDGFLAAIYKAKGKAPVESRRLSSTPPGMLGMRLGGN